MIKRNIVIIIGISVLLLCAGFSVGLTRTITDSSDTSISYIMTSNGNFFPVNVTGLQDAVDDVENNGGKVNIPDCEIEAINEKLIVLIDKKNITIQGNGASSVLKVSNSLASEGDIISLEKSSGGCENITIRDLRFIVNSTYASDQCIDSDGTKNLTISNCFMDSNIQAIGIDDGSENVFIEHCKITHISSGLNIRGGSSKISISNCYFNGKWDGHNIEFGSSDKVTISNCHFYNGYTCNIFVDSTADNIVISGNTFDTAFNCVKVLKGDNISIANNFFTGSTDYAIYLNGMSTDWVYDCVVLGNILDECAKGIKITYVNDSIIDNNIFDDITVIDIYKAAGCYYNLINGLGYESANANEPQYAEWDVGNMVNFTDSGDGSGNGIYIMNFDGDWDKLN